MERDGRRLMRMMAVFGFDDNSYDPEQYADWVESKAEEAREAFGRMPRSWPSPVDPERSDLDAG
ncbi:MAG: hypothetical protein SF187_29830 [Deltaproteobacteria bacterium]|nr:hypothetical protein [Deltaproteobacteria bacterium]